MTLHSEGQRKLRSIVERIEALRAQQKELGEDIKEIMLEAKSSGFNPAIIRKVLKLKQKSAAERKEEEEVLALYLEALGMTPMEEYIAQHEEAA